LEYYARDLNTQPTPRKNYVDELNNVSLEDVQKAVATALSSKPTVVVQGGNTYKLNSYDEVANAFK
jgi:predicted Zn-dependent peptidase